MKIAIPKEQRPDESRVAASPETVKKLINLGFEVAVEKGAGLGAAIPDAAYEAAGAAIAADATVAFGSADVVAKVRRPLPEETKGLKAGTLVISIADPFRAGDELKPLQDAGVTAFAMDLIPRITRAQSMDVLSSQSNLAGYKAVLDAAAAYGSAFPQMMTAAGTVPPAKALVMGAGVAGLQAIATAKRLGAIVSATDVRPAAKEQVESLGGKFVAVEDEEFKQAETAGGYAKEMSPEYQKKQAALIAETIAKMDIVITTALIPGRPAPKLISKEMVESMKPGSVIVDLAVETGGNCELSQPGKVVDVNGVKIVGYVNVPSRLAADASALYARNIYNFIELLVDKEEKKLAVNWEDQIVADTCIIRDGKLVHPALAPQEEAPQEDVPGEEAPAEPAAEEEKSDDSSDGQGG
ncbi:Re/Si-specific NAD(P)(+) transhydrogenase subunit alpha [Pelagibius sp. CAU 1746]|uniref:Re/Si-specific NAD(P)(+) transhydrogenase subunit alpha n=1 Tax=Pelagibius sp. CAU 1746 TaxID=3140370 RepID=UPI00325B3046